jgi:hypothetical protein
MRPSSLFILILIDVHQASRIKMALNLHFLKKRFCMMNTSSIMTVALVLLGLAIFFLETALTGKMH